ncbi:MAG TPA: lysophospholipid acyltransferase family protein [Terriglobales bacterium]|nr:lysophospholipid acyltransferase family protein [Terriglobales bacterium]
MIRSLILASWYALAIVTLGPVGIVHAFITNDISWLYWRAMWVANFGLRTIGVRIEVEGRDRFDPNGTYIYMLNHVSNLDPPLVIPLLPRRTSVLLKKELMKIPILSRAMKMAQFVPVDRSNREAAITSISRAVDVLRDGVNISIFPEGTRSRDGKLLPFKKGPFHLAIESGVDIIPVTIHGTEQMMPKGRNTIRPGVAHVIFHAPVSPKDHASREELTEAVRKVIESSLPAEMRST